MNPLRRRLIIGSLVALGIAVVFFRDFLAGVPGLLGTEGLRRYGVYGWGILGVCCFWIFLKKDAIWAGMRRLKTGRVYFLAGAVLLGGGLALPAFNPFVAALKMLVMFLGVFVILFGEAAVIPAIVLAIYAFSLAFPPLTQRLAEGAWGETTLALAKVLAPLFGVGLETTGNMVSVIGPASERVSVLVTYECAGQITMGIFLALFALMMMDVPVPWRRAVPLLLLGILGTTVQNLVRIEGVLMAAQWWGWEGFNRAHQYVAYVVFPTWYAVFAIVYFRVARRRER